MKSFRQTIIVYLWNMNVNMFMEFVAIAAQLQHYQPPLLLLVCLPGSIDCVCILSVRLVHWYGLCWLCNAAVLLLPCC